MVSGESGPRGFSALFLDNSLVFFPSGDFQDDMTDSRQPLSFAEHFEFYFFFFFLLTLSVDPATIHPVKEVIIVLCCQILENQDSLD